MHPLVLTTVSCLLGGAVARYSARQVNGNLTEPTSALFPNASYPTDVIIQIQIGDLTVAETFDLTQIENATSFAYSSLGTLPTVNVASTAPSISGASTTDPTISITAQSITGSSISPTDPINTESSMSITGSSISPTDPINTESSMSIIGPSNSITAPSVTSTGTASSYSNATSVPMANFTYSFMTIPTPQFTSLATPTSANSSLTGGTTLSQPNTALLSALLCAIFGISC